MGCENPILPNIVVQVLSHATLLIKIGPSFAYINSISGESGPGIPPKTQADPPKEHFLKKGNRLQA
jgi:hypothetical protein